MSLNPVSLLTKTLEYADETVQTTSPWKLVACTTAVAVLATFFTLRWAQRKTWDLKAAIMSGLRCIPFVDQKIKGELKKMEESLEAKLFSGINSEDICREVPRTEWDVNRIMERLKDVEGSARNGKNTGAYYIDNRELDELILQVSWLARRTNPLHGDLSPLVRQLEAEIVRMTLSMFKGDEMTVGNVTSGGTDSIRHAVFTARERARANGFGAGWKMVVPETAHPAFAKAANEYGITLRRVPVYPQGHPKAFQLDVDAMKKAIHGNTVLVVGSMPPFPHGIPDPIEEISAMLQAVDPKGNIGLHVDCCLGGFVVPWMEAAGYGKDAPLFGFDVPRVTSISADTHKYGYGEKGTSVVMYRDHENWRQHQIFVETEWSGGIYATPTLAGSRSGRDIAALWAVMAYMGRKGYIEETRKIIAATRWIAGAIENDVVLNENLEILGDPKMMVVAFASKDPGKLNIHDLKDEMKKKGWYLSSLQKPPGLHFCTTAVHGNNPDFVKDFSMDLKECVEIVLAYPEEKRAMSGEAAMYCSNQKLGDKMFIPVLAKEFWNINGRAEPVTDVVLST